MSEIGGLMKILQALANAITGPITHFLFMFVMIKKMYFAKSSNTNLFK